MKKQLNYDEFQLARRVEAYRAERAMRGLLPWAMAAITIAVVGAIGIVGALL